MLSRWARSIRIMLTPGLAESGVPAMRSAAFCWLASKAAWWSAATSGRGETVAPGGGAVGGVVERRGIGMDRDERIGVEPAGDLVAFVEAAIAVVLAGHGDAHPAGGDERVAGGGGEGQRAGPAL